MLTKKISPTKLNQLVQRLISVWTSVETSQKVIEIASKTLYNHNIYLSADEKLKTRKLRSCLDVLVRIGVTRPLKNPTPTHFFTKSPLNLQTAQALLFRQFPSYILVFCEPPPKNQIFQ